MGAATPTTDNFIFQLYALWCYYSKVGWEVCQWRVQATFEAWTTGSHFYKLNHHHHRSSLVGLKKTCFSLSWKVAWENMKKYVKMSQKVRRNLFRNWRAWTVFKDFKKKAKKRKEIYLKTGNESGLKKLCSSGFLQIGNRYYCFNTTWCI